MKALAAASLRIEGRQGISKNLKECVVSVKRLPHHTYFDVCFFIRFASFLPIQGNLPHLRKVKPALSDHGELQPTNLIRISVLSSAFLDSLLLSFNQCQPRYTNLSESRVWYLFFSYFSMYQTSGVSVEKFREQRKTYIFFECLLLKHMVASTPFSELQSPLLLSSYPLLLPLWSDLLNQPAFSLFLALRITSVIHVLKKRALSNFSQHKSRASL